MDEGCVGLREFLDPIADQLDCYQMERMKRTHWVTLEGDFNWKCVQDNFNESYHLPFVHPQTLPVMNEHYTGCQFDLYPSGHNRMLMPGGGPRPGYTGNAERTFQGFAEEFAFWEFDPEPYRDDLRGLRARAAAAQARARRQQGLRLLPLLRRAAHRPLPLHGVPEPVVQHEARRLHLPAGQPAPDRPDEVPTSTCGT